MSGSGSSGAGNRGAVGGEELDCASLRVRTVLNSPNPAVVPGLSPGQVLTVELQDTSGRAMLVAVTDGGDTAGSLTPPVLARIIQCAQGGFQYVAVVESVDGGRCVVEIRPRSAP